MKFIKISCGSHDNLPMDGLQHVTFMLKFQVHMMCESMWNSRYEIHMINTSVVPMWTLIAVQKVPSRHRY